MATHNSARVTYAAAYPDALGRRRQRRHKDGATLFSLADDWPDFTARFPERDCARWPWWRRHGRPQRLRSQCVTA